MRKLTTYAAALAGALAITQPAQAPKFAYMEKPAVEIEKSLSLYEILERSPVPLEVKATAYSYTGDKTANGSEPLFGKTIAVDPLVIPLGRKVYISQLDSNSPDFQKFLESIESEKELYTFLKMNKRELDGYFRTEDTGRLIKGAKIDFYIDDETLALEFGTRPLTLKLLPLYAGN
ncbi:MAG TPA: 3D domain-containing protein [archaeon]|nr:3D domain-containing protein [archaeon]